MNIYELNIEIRENETIYHMNPDEFKKRNPNINVEQAYIFCKLCNQWKNLSEVNVPNGMYNFRKQTYIGGYCLSAECLLEQEQKQNE